MTLKLSTLLINRGEWKSRKQEPLLVLQSLSKEFRNKKEVNSPEIRTEQEGEYRKKRKNSQKMDIEDHMHLKGWQQGPHLYKGKREDTNSERQRAKNNGKGRDGGSP